MSLELVKRVFQDDKCIGYYVSDGSKILPVKIEQVYGYAKNKRIANVAIRNNNGSLVLYGINGFRIEDLPVEKVKTSSNKIEVKEIYILGPLIKLSIRKPRTKNVSEECKLIARI